jgi:hypothetical protein
MGFSFVPLILAGMAAIMYVSPVALKASYTKAISIYSL